MKESYLSRVVNCDKGNMERCISETPDKWVMIKLPGDYYKVFATWAGGYLKGDSWKLNSGVESVEQDEDFYYFTGFSGSCYKCHKRGYGVATSYGVGILDKILEHGKGQIELMKDIDLLDGIVKIKKCGTKDNDM